MCHFVIQFLKGSSVDLTKYTLSALKRIAQAYLKIMAILT